MGGNDEPEIGNGKYRFASIMLTINRTLDAINFMAFAYCVQEFGCGSAALCLLSLQNLEVEKNLPRVSDNILNSIQWKFKRIEIVVEVLNDCRLHLVGGEWN